VRGPEWLNYVGLDLGKLSDPSALALVRWRTGLSPHGSGTQLVPEERRRYRVETLKRWALGTPYLSIADDLARFLGQDVLEDSPPLLVVDATGVGNAVCELIQARLDREGLPWSKAAVTITGGSAVTQTGSGQWRVAKKELVSILQRLLGEGRLHVEPTLPEAALLARELGTFQVKITEGKNETFESWREKDHDDLVLAVALACWAPVGQDLLSEAVMARWLPGASPTARRLAG
jgi:hypothetical protein